MIVLVRLGLVDSFDLVIFSFSQKICFCRLNSLNIRDATSSLNAVRSARDIAASPQINLSKLSLLLLSVSLFCIFLSFSLSLIPLLLVSFSLFRVIQWFRVSVSLCLSVSMHLLLSLSLCLFDTVNLFSLFSSLSLCFSSRCLSFSGSPSYPSLSPSPFWSPLRFNKKLSCIWRSNKFKTNLIFKFCT